MDLCDYIQNLYETYFAATNTLVYRIADVNESVTMFIGELGILLLQLDEWEEPIMYGVGSHISGLKTPHGYENFIAYISRFDEDLPEGEYNDELNIHLYYV